MSRADGKNEESGNSMIISAFHPIKDRTVQAGGYKSPRGIQGAAASMERVPEFQFGARIGKTVPIPKESANDRQWRHRSVGRPLIFLRKESKIRIEEKAATPYDSRHWTEKANGEQDSVYCGALRKRWQERLIETPVLIHGMKKGVAAISATPQPNLPISGRTLPNSLLTDKAKDSYA